MAARLVSRGQSDFSLEGALDFDSVAALWEEARVLFREQIPARIDLADVERSDSSGVALLVDWLGQARADGQAIEFVNVPAQMQAIIQIADLDELLPVS